MRRSVLLQVLESVAAGSKTPQQALKDVGSLAAAMPLESYAKLDSLREVRTGFPEVIFGQGKTIEHLGGVLESSLRGKNSMFATRVDRETHEAVLSYLTGKGHGCHVQSSDVYKYYPEARIISTYPNQETREHGAVVSILTGGTADITVAEEAAVTLQLNGIEPRRVFDVGVAGLGRLLNQVEALRESNVIIAVAGMEGALPSVVSGLVDCPVIAVPTSVGYGCNMEGLVPLLAMLNGCSPGVSVVNIDNGFGAAAITMKIIDQL